jgi:MtfA peptidase
VAPLRRAPLTDKVATAHDQIKSHHAGPEATMFGLKTRRRERLRATPFPELWMAILGRNVPYYARLSRADRAELCGNIQVFLAEKNFEGCGGLELTEEIKITVAAYACVLLLHRAHDFYPRLQSVLVYPDAYAVPVTRRGPGNMLLEDSEVRAGESWGSGAVVVSWNHSLCRPGDLAGGHNVILHEFAHQLDQEDGVVNGAPLLPTTSMYRTWARILGREFQNLAADAEADRPTLLDKYGASNPAEFFAVVTECFFERPQPLRDRHPELYAALQAYYRQNPAATGPG